jgi:CheY-specific phosphatase CheX
MMVDRQTSELAQVVGLVFETMLGLEVFEAAGTFSAHLPAAPFPEHAELMTAAVYLSGKHRGAVLIHCAAPLACELAGRFLSVDPPGGVDDDVLDVLGELTNMVAGNLRCTLLPGTYLSIPSVMEGPPSKLRVCQSRGADRAAFLTVAGPFWVTMVTTEG